MGQEVPTLVYAFWMCKPVQKKYTNVCHICKQMLTGPVLLEHNYWCTGLNDKKLNVATLFIYYYNGVVCVERNAKGTLCWCTEKKDRKIERKKERNLSKNKRPVLCTGLIKRPYALH